ncbi:MAG TPA: AAA family ATPase [Candidatus Babeliales bacterium]|jgi:ATP-dependent Zn protease|nr:AAA family ATPase [Candidatus Babeliales bacterium]
MKKMQYVLIALLISDISSLDARYNSMSIDMEAARKALTASVAIIAGAALTGIAVQLGAKVYDYLSDYFSYNPIGDVVIPEVKFSDIIGAQEAKEELQDVVAFLKKPETYLDIGARIPKGILLEGPPGNGKTLLAKALAGEAGVKFFAVDGGSFTHKFTGEGVAEVKSLFNKARNNTPCIIFFDEIDGIGKRNPEPYNAENNKMIATLLTQIDGIGTDPHRLVFIVAATNNRELIDEALIRSGRIDTTVVVKNPNTQDREKMLKFYTDKTKRKDIIIANIDFNKLAIQSEGFSGADIENLVNKAKIFAVRNKRRVPTQQNFDNALEQIKRSKEKLPVKLRPNYMQHSNTISSMTQDLIGKRAGILFQFKKIIKPSPNTE